jgi:hypothetical protein
MRLATVVTVVALGAGACSNLPRKEFPMNKQQSATDDEQLVTRVRAAVETRVPAGDLAAFVGQRPLIDTTAGASLDFLRTVDFAADPDHPSETVDIAKARAIVYWGRPVPGNDPRVVGVQLGEHGVPRVFFAVILPP